MTFSDKNTLIRTLCVALVTTVLLLAVLLLVAGCGDFAGDGTPEETTRRPFRPSLEDVTLDPEDIMKQGVLDFDTPPYVSADH